MVCLEVKQKKQNKTGPPKIIRAVPIGSGGAEKGTRGQRTNDWKIPDLIG